MWVIRPRSIIGRDDSATARVRRGAGPIAHEVPKADRWVVGAISRHNAMIGCDSPSWLDRLLASGVLGATL
jgi:hypothetical protein